MSTIESGLRADVMRKRMEDKNTLGKKGSLYAGLGTSTSIVTTDPLGNTQTYEIYDTTALNPPTEIVDDVVKIINGKILITDNNEEKGLKWGSEVPSLTIGTLETGNGGITNAGDITNGGDFTNGGNIINTGNITVGADDNIISLDSSNGKITSNSLETDGINVTGNGGITNAGNITNSGNFNNNGNITNAGDITVGTGSNIISLNSSNGKITSNSLGTGSITASGNIASASINTGSVTSSGAISCNDITTNSITNSGPISNSGNITVGSNIVLNATSGNVGATTFNSNTIKSSLQDSDWDKTDVIPTAKAILDKIAGGTAGVATVNANPGNIVIKSGDSLIKVETARDPSLDNTTNITLSLLCTQVHTW